jgi:chaperone modulatory protein CbpM
MAGVTRIGFAEVVSRTRVSDAELTEWVRLSWVRPARAADAAADAAPTEAMTFSDADLARIELLCDLAHDMGIDSGAMEVILPLLDQVYALRRDLRALTRAVDTLPKDARAAVLRQVWGEDGEG